MPNLLASCNSHLQGCARGNSLEVLKCFVFVAFHISSMSATVIDYSEPVTPLEKWRWANRITHRYKIVLLGDPGCGKTSIITRFIYGSFDTTYQAVHGFRFYSSQRSESTFSPKPSWWKDEGFASSCGTRLDRSRIRRGMRTQTLSESDPFLHSRYKRCRNCERCVQYFVSLCD